MATQGVKPLLDTIEELHRFERSGGKIEDFKALTVETRSAILKFQSEIFRIVKKVDFDPTFLDSLNATSLKAVNSCNLSALIADLYPNANTKFLATFIIISGDFSIIEALLNAIK